MTTLALLKANQLAARKNRAADPELADLLTTALGSATTRAKNEQREPADADAVWAAERLTTAAREIVAKAPGTEHSAKAEREIAHLAAYLPTQLDVHELRAAVGTAVGDAEREGKVGPAARGYVMGLLKARYAGRYDGAEASKLVAHLLTPAGA
jgi:uncharacterized protein YqeY